MKTVTAEQTADRRAKFCLEQFRNRKPLFGHSNDMDSTIAQFQIFNSCFELLRSRFKDLLANFPRRLLGCLSHVKCRAARARRLIVGRDVGVRKTYRSEEHT